MLVKARGVLVRIVLGLVAVAIVAGTAIVLRSGGWHAKAPSSWAALDLSPLPRGEWLSYRYPTTYTCLAVSKGVVWVGTDSGFVERRDLRTGEVEYFPCDASLNIPTIVPVISGIQVDRTGQV